jgi:peptidoglycan/xylan/chitin deacetylase (PgdA/CDA1 family)
MVLEALDALEAKATFFVLGKHVRENPELALDIHERGHDLALHGMAHRRHDRLSSAEAISELESGASAIEAVVGKRPRWYRPPYGRASRTLGSVCHELSLELVYWSSWGFDWEPLPPEEIARSVLRDIGPGTVVLLHDSARYAERSDAAATAAALPTIVAAARDAGLTLQPLSKVVGSEASRFQI